MEIMNYTQEQIDNAFDKLPDTLKEAILSVKNFEILKKIRESYKLST